MKKYYTRVWLEEKLVEQLEKKKEEENAKNMSEIIKLLIGAAK